MAVIKQIKDSSGTTYDIIDTDTKDTAGVSTTTRPLYLIGTHYDEESVNAFTEKIATTYSCGDSVYVNPTTGTLTVETINANAVNTNSFSAPEIYSNKITVGSIILDRSTQSITLSGAVNAGSIVCEGDTTVGGNIVVGSGTGGTSTSTTSGVVKCNRLTCFAAGSSASSIDVDGFDGTITANGDITAKGFYQSSDERLKTFTEDYIINLDDIKNIKTGKFYWNSDESQVINGGVTAQSVEKYFPELVREDENGTKTVNYDGLAVVAIAAIKKLTERIEELENIVYNK